MEDWLNLIIVFLGSSLACFVQRYVGFAYGLISLTIWISFIEIHTAILLSLVGAFLGQCVNFKNNRNMEIKSARFFLLGGILGMLLSFYFLSDIDLTDVKTGLGTLMVLFFLLNIFLYRTYLKYKENKFAELLVGSIGGGMGILGAGFGMVPSVWCTLNNYSKESYFSIMIFFNMIIIFLSSLFHLSHFQIEINYLYFAVLIFSIYTSNLLFKHKKFRINFSTVRVVVNFIVLLQGLILIYHSLIVN
ncbi:hypothetical protein AMD27_15160 [Acinetobacter sp. TGL-Y2]|uniref:TSUP family transporter n=1 Tax=Acinetobacter sp. TGL-Y2 TaxID=1407071 RepID=UPI0007A64DEC|nr:TSUP family transporter [Acinetobacter sp. TGL-Y2]AMW80103.1 hypothetical protein AMD27_15160 [Acinetobacter sp. TGL-Y2]